MCFLAKIWWKTAYITEHYLIQMSIMFGNCQHLINTFWRKFQMKTQYFLIMSCYTMLHTKIHRDRKRTPHGIPFKHEIPAYPSINPAAFSNRCSITAASPGTTSAMALTLRHLLAQSLVSLVQQLLALLLRIVRHDPDMMTERIRLRFHPQHDLNQSTP